ncbi:MAG: homocysteine S-methyltransferase family protein [Syntrophales bacterium]|jgi:5-methyltetrahydrofolate--homocysteine methyltransferase
MKKISDQVKVGHIFISDGAWGTRLQSLGAKPGECLEHWNISHPDEVLSIAGDYVASGSDMIETNSFGGSRIKLDLYGLANQTEQINEAAAAISRKAAGADCHVLGSMGPTGKILLLGDINEETLYSAFSQQAVALKKGGADACCIETFMALDEALCAVRAVRENTDLEIICTFTFEKTKKGEYRTAMGVRTAQMVHALIDAGADIIGTNCGNGMAQMVEIVREIRTVDSKIPILVHANAGLPTIQDGEMIYPETPEAMASYLPALIEAGAGIIGGCCGTTPAHISALVAARQRLQGSLRGGT